jgi:hypothetical protein
MIAWDQRYRPLVEGEIILATDEIQQDDGTWKAAVSVGMPAPSPAYSSHRKYRRLIVRKMVSGDLWHRSEHRFAEDCWGGGRTDCRRCGAFLNSFYDDEGGCRGPTWMRAGEDWDGGRSV